ncbi:MAG: hypothetical protein PHQ40_12545 [Anaerolineaceae bacterium]|nr:hypothetical protein [Anaerolineaceae bacterium]
MTLGSARWGIHHFKGIEGVTARTEEGTLGTSDRLETLQRSVSTRTASLPARRLYLWGVSTSTPSTCSGLPFPGDHPLPQILQK